MSDTAGTGAGEVDDSGGGVDFVSSLVCDFREEAVFFPEGDGFGDVCVGVTGAFGVAGDGEHGGAEDAIEHASGGSGDTFFSIHDGAEPLVAVH